MNKKVRLLITKQCPNNCPMCCNKSYDLDSLPVIDRWDYDEYIITGGEPALFLHQLNNLLSAILTAGIISGKENKIYIYSSKTAIFQEEILSKVNGVTYTPHSAKDIEFFMRLNESFLENGLFCHYEVDTNPTLRLCLFPEIKALLPKDIDLSLWEVKDIEWKKNCPVPEGEDFRRINVLWTRPELN